MHLCRKDGRPSGGRPHTEGKDALVCFDMQGESEERGFIQLRIQLTKTHAYDTSIYDFGSITHENAEILF